MTKRRRKLKPRNTFEVHANFGTQRKQEPKPMQAANLARKLNAFSVRLQPRVVRQLNGHDVTVVRLGVEFVWPLRRPQNLHGSWASRSQGKSWTSKGNTSSRSHRRTVSEVLDIISRDPRRARCRVAAEVRPLYVIFTDAALSGLMPSIEATVTEGKTDWLGS